MTAVHQIKATTGVCSECVERVPATVYERDSRVYLRTSCARHGEAEALIANDASLYWNADAASCGAGACCGPGAAHSCTLIFEITERCNLTCPTCFTASSPHHTWAMSFDDFAAKLDRLLLAGKSDSDIVQISGGEPTVHPELERFVAHCFERGIKKVYLNTNGVRLSTDRGLAERLAAIDAGQDRLQIYLQFDGFADSTYAQIRGARGLAPVKRRAVERLLEVGLFAVPVMAVTRGVNLHEIGDLIRFARAHHPYMNAVMLQPAFYAGRYENDTKDTRVTMTEIAHEVVRQTNGLFSLDDFTPIPCSHPSCFGMAVAFARGGRFIPVSRYFPRMEQWKDPALAPLMSRVSDHLPASMLDALSDDDALDQLLDLLGESDDSTSWSSYRDFFVVGIKPFMDAHTYDQDRVDRCCVHVVDRAGQPVSLCEYNVLRRPRGLL
ncbi:MAG: radical SAM protein [Gemmatimonadaceae bacterium]